jgi:hypothetical protein
MQNDRRSFDENEWTAEERARFAALSTERLPPAELEQRTAQALRSRGLLGPRTRFSGPMIIGLLLAASIVFAAGVLAGYAAANRRPSATPERAVATSRSVARLDSVDSSLQRTRHVVWY